MFMNDVYLALGSNLGDKKLNIHLAIKKIEENIGHVVSVSSMHETSPVGFSSKNLFVNAACMVLSELSPEDILLQTQKIEQEMGRKNKSSNKIYSDRIIDIDMLMYNNSIIKSPSLVLPHPHLHERAFVLDPLAEIAENTLHPVLNKTIQQLKEDLK